ncbi:MAG: PD-(D/E)XK nuclease family protein [Paludibacteraceae bacterium]|nr:PD-(D/E)XK nuclease family protein [Paludibacteraceae bacterium]
MKTKAFLREVIDDLICRYGWQQLGELTLVVPSRRAALAAKEYIKESAKSVTDVIQLPQMITLIDLQNSLSKLYVADEVYLVTSLYHVYREVLKEAKVGKYTSLATFYAWGSQLIQDFSGIDKAYPLVEPDKFLSNTAEARELEQLDIDDDVRERLLDIVGNIYHAGEADSKRAVFTFLWQHLGDIYRRLQTALGDRSYEGARMKDVLVNWDSDYVQSRLNKYYVFAGFNYLVPAEQELMHRLKDAGRADFYWEYPTDFTANTHAFRWVKRNAERFGNQLTPLAWQQSKPVTVISTASSHAQTQYVYTWLKEHHHNGERSAIIICDEQMLEPVIYALPDDKSDSRFERINITKGFPMRRTIIFAEIIAWLQNNGNNVHSGENYADVLRRLIAFVGDKMAAVPKPENEEEEVQLTWHELLQGESLYQAHTALIRLFDSLQTESIFSEITNLRTLRLLVRRYLESLSFPFHGEPLTEIQVTGMLETRALDFDNLLLLNVEEGIVPNAVSDRSYIPFYLRKYYGLQTHEEATDVYAYNFFRLLHRAEHITILFTATEQAKTRKSMSRFIRQMMMSGDFSVRRMLLTEKNALMNKELPLFDSARPNMLSVLHKDSRGNLCYEDGKPYRISPSAISTADECSMKFYLQYVLGIKEPEEETQMYSPAEIGDLMHNTIQVIYESLGFRGQPFEMTPSLLQTIDDKAIEEALIKAEKKLGERYNSILHPIETNVVRRYVKQIIAADLQLAQTQGLTLLAQERSYYMPLDLGETGIIQVGGRIDRVDRVGGVPRIVDYKSGRKLEKKYKQQTAIYSVVWKNNNSQSQAEPLEQVIYFPGFKVDKVVTSLPPDNAVPDLQEKVTAILSAAPVKKEGNCKSYCPFLGICNKKPEQY